MWGLNKKKKDEEEIEVKEIKPRTRRKKNDTEEKKPWGKNERYLLLSLLVLTVLGSAVLALAARSWKLPGLPRLKLPEEAFSETFILESNQENTQEELISKEKAILDEFALVTKNLSGVYGLSVVDLNSGKRFGLHEDETFQAASLIKLPLMTMMFEQSEKKRLNLDSKYSLKEEDKVGGSGSLYYEEPGFVLTFRRMIELMGKSSDNTAFNIGIKTVGEGNFQDYISLIGMRDTSYETNMTSPRDISNFFKKLWENRLVNQDNRDDLLEYLSDTQYENYLSAGVPEEIQVAHKYGREIHVVNDAGIVFAEAPFIVVILTKGVVESEAEEVFPTLSKIVFEGMTK